jgi:cell division protein FtsI/penicillin-binding protein 2
LKPSDRIFITRVISRYRQTNGGSRFSNSAWLKAPLYARKDGIAVISHQVPAHPPNPLGTAAVSDPFWELSVRNALQRSLNTVTVRLAQDIGMPLIGEYAKRFGVYDELPNYLSYALGAGETTMAPPDAGNIMRPGTGLY